MPDEVKAAEQFAGRFVRKYWETVKSRAFPMPPNKPVKESVEELLARISYESEFGSDLDHPRLCKIRMMNTSGDWWLFRFRWDAEGWELIGSLAGHRRKKYQHDLLGPVYAKYFEPFLRHVTSAANS